MRSSGGYKGGACDPLSHRLPDRARTAGSRSAALPVAQSHLWCSSAAPIKAGTQQAPP
jgi:hypothetical protein